MSSDSDSDLCDFSSDLTKHMSKGQDKLWKNFQAKQSENTTKENILESDTNDKSNESATVEEFVLVNDEPVETCGSNVIAVVNVPVENTNLCVCGNIVNKLNELSDTVQEILKDNVRQTRRKKGARNRKRCAPPVSRKSVRRQIQNNIVPLLTVDSSDDEVTIEPSHNTETPSENKELDPTLMVKVLWKSSENKIFKVKKFQPLQCIHEYFTNEAKVDPKLLFFTVDDMYVDLQNNSYVSLRLDNKNIEGGILPQSYLNNPIQYPKLSDKGLLRFKVQFNAGRKKEFTVSCKQSDKVEFILWQIIKEIKVPAENIRLSFDGKFLKSSDLISNLDLEEEDCFDLEVI